MATERLLADVLQEIHDAKKSGALFVSVTAESENLIRFYFDDGGIIHLNFGPINDLECLEVLDCYNLNKAVFFKGHKSPSIATNLPNTVNIIALVRKNGKKVLLD